MRDRVGARGLGDVYKRQRHEGALHLDDVMERRTRIAIEYSHRGIECAREVADLMAPIMGWTADQTDAEVAGYCARAQAEIESQRLPDDEAADALRVAAPEARPQIVEPPVAE